MPVWQGADGLDEADGEAEAAGNALDRGPAIDQRSKDLGFVGGIHRQTVEVLGKAGLDCGLGGVFEHQAGHFVVFGQNFVLGQRQHGLAAAFAGLDLEFAFGTGANDEILQQPARSDAGLELGIGCWI